MVRLTEVGTQVKYKLVNWLQTVTEAIEVDGMAEGKNIEEEKKIYQELLGSPLTTLTFWFDEITTEETESRGQGRRRKN